MTSENIMTPPGVPPKTTKGVQARSVLNCSVVITICCVLFIHRTNLFTNFTNLVSQTSKFIGNNSFTFVDMLEKHSSPDDKLIILAMTDYAFVDMAVNMYETSFKRHGIKNFLFVGAGQKSCEVLITKYSLPCFHYANDTSANVANVYGSPDFNRKMNIRTYMIIDALQAGYTVLHTDIDVVFLKNPLPEIREITKKTDIAALWDNSVYNAGFLAIKPTNFSINVYKRMKSVTDASASTADQTALNSAIGDISRTVSPGSFSVVALDRKKYLCGLAYYEHGNRYFPSDCAECIVVHNNWIVSREAKVYRFKEHLTWMFDGDTYYTNSTRKYICYSNPMTWSSQLETEKEELGALETALAIGQLLDRIVILPRFHCDGKERPLNSLVSMIAFDAIFSGKYRENSFLRHPWIPPNLRNPVNVSHLISTPHNSHFSHNKLVTGVTLNTTGKENVREDVVRKHFSGVKDQILQFVHLYRVPFVFTDEKLQSKFKLSSSSGLKRKGYRQL